MKQRGLGPGARLRRARRTAATFGRIYLGLRAERVLTAALPTARAEERWQRFHRRSAREVLALANELQGLVLKGCQSLGTRADVLPPAWVETLSALQDRVPPRPFEVVRASVEGELGARLEEIFASFARAPIASASLAQVHEARLRGGPRVAVKVQYPEIEALVRSDLRNLRALFRAVDWLERDFDLMPLVEELGVHVPRELHFVNEAHNLETIGRFFKDRDDVAVPGVHWEFTTRRVLVMDFVDGIKISDVEGLRAAGLDPEAVARTLAEAYCEQVLVHGLFHADPHPGNLRVQVREDGSPRLVFLDFGLVKQLPDRFRADALAFAGALLTGRAEEMAEAMEGLGFETRRGGRESLEELAQLVLEIAQRVRHGVHLDRDTAARFAREVPERVRRNRLVRIPSHLVLLGRVLGLLSGVNHSLGSRLDLARAILPYVARPPRPQAEARPA